MGRRGRSSITRETSKHIRSRRKYKHKGKGKFYNEHHIIPRCRGGPDRDYNILHKAKIMHAAWHELFAFRTPSEAANLLKISIDNQRGKKAYATVFGYGAALEQALNIIQNDWSVNEDIYQTERRKRVDTLIEFLAELKKNGYSFNAKQRIRFFDCKFATRFQKGEYEYKNDYFGFNPCDGREIVRQNARQIYVMQHFSNIIANNIAVEEIYVFLEKALKAVDKNPFRGPKEYSQDRFLYTNHQEGSIEKFYGLEEIFCDGQKVYECRYHGGLLIAK